MCLLSTKGLLNMIDQKIEIEIKNKYETLGVLSITSTIDSHYDDKFKSIQPKKIKCITFNF